ncbi:hypothetical protein [Desulfovibrio desulfuricans]|uniref:hypothetical protein n=1 Tax=Desulfovibrio desulfuricans TaxID=876 RepID=UPI00131EA81F|nr:hypothetical protein [Desulfovibrio desulfuricans]
MAIFVAGTAFNNSGETPSCEECKKEGKEVLMVPLKLGATGRPDQNLKKIWRCPDCGHQIDIN